MRGINIAILPITLRLSKLAIGLKYTHSGCFTELIVTVCAVLYGGESRYF